MVQLTQCTLGLNLIPHILSHFSSQNLLGIQPHVIVNTVGTRKETCIVLLCCLADFKVKEYSTTCLATCDCAIHRVCTVMEVFKVYGTFLLHVSKNLDSQQCPNRSVPLSPAMQQV